MLHIDTKCAVAIRYPLITYIGIYQFSSDHTQPFVVKIFEVYETEDYVYVILELVSGGALFEFVQERGFIHEPVAKALFYQMLLGVKVSVLFYFLLLTYLFYYWMSCVIS